MNPPSLWETVFAIREQRQCCFGATAALLHAIEAGEPRLACWAQLDADAALAQATARDVALHAADGAIGPLFGVAIGIKDMIDVAGVRTGCGSPLRHDHRAECDAPVVAALRQAGAIVLGKTVTTQFACFDPAETRNPWNAACTPGGSSSGSAAAVAAGMCPAALGTQTGGSISRPAAYCGVVGWKPAFGAVSSDGVFPVSRRLDHVGCFARHVADVLPVREVLLAASSDAGGAPTFDETAGVLEHLLTLSRRPPELLVPRNFFLDRCDRDARAAFDDACDALAAAGAELHSASLPEELHAVALHHGCIMAVDAHDVHREQFAASPNGFAANLRGLLTRGRDHAEEQYAEAVAFQAAFRGKMEAAAAGRIVVTPATPTAAPADRSTTGDPICNAPWSHCGWPTIVLPSGLSDAGLPLAIQLAAPPECEEDMLAAALWAEDVFRFEENSTPPWRA